MARQDDIRKLITQNSRRLQVLQEQQALYGGSVDPRVLIEIADIEAKIEKLKTRYNSKPWIRIELEGHFSSLTIKMSREQE